MTTTPWPTRADGTNLRISEMTPEDRAAMLGPLEQQFREALASAELGRALDEADDPPREAAR